MRRVIVLLIFAVAAIGQPVVSNVRTDYVPAPNGAAPHSYMRFRWNVNSSACYHRIQFGKTVSHGNTLFNQGCQVNDLGFPLSGLAPSTTYFYLVQSSFDNATWSTGVTGSFTTAALPATHPALPQISGLWNPTFPNTSGYNQVTTATNCSNLNALIAAAVTLQPTNGTVITIPNEATASAACGPVQFPNDTQILSLPQDSTHVNTTTGVFTATSIPSGWTLTNGQTVMLVGTCLPGSLSQGNDGNSFNPGTGCTAQGPIVSGVVYYIVGASGSTFQLSATSGGSPIIPGDTGRVGQTMMLAQWPLMNSNWIVIQTSTPDSLFCPQGVRCMGSIWQSKMAHIQAQGGCYNCNGGNTGFFTHNVWFRGIDLDATDASNLATTTVDPQPTNNLFNAPYTWMSSYIVFDRSYIHCPPFPNRCQSVINAFGGRNMALIDNDLENWNFWRPSATPVALGNTAEGLSGTLTGSTLTIIPGSIKAPVITCTSTANITFTITGGSASGTAYVYASSVPAAFPGPPLLAPCVPTMVMPTGMTATCTGSMTDSTSTSHACSVITAASPGFPVDTSNGLDAFALGTFTLTSGVASAYGGQQNFGHSNWWFEGTQGLQAGAGPGPFTFNGNYLEGSGLLIHLDDSSIVDQQSVWFRQNTFFWDQSHRIGSSTSDGYEYGNRNGPECKHCRQVKFDGNILSGTWNSVSLTGPSLLFHTASNQGTVGTAGGIGQPGYTVQDIDITNNTFNNVATCIEAGGGVMNMTPQAAAARIRISNNICNTNAWTQTDGNTGAAPLGGGAGTAIELDGAIEDLIVDHNTLFDLRGSNPQIWHAQVSWIEGCQVTNNFLWFNQNSQGFSGEQNGGTVLTPAIGGSGSAMFNSLCTNDPGTPGGILSNNVAVPYYANSQTQSGYLGGSGVCTSFGGTWNSGTRTCVGGQIGVIDDKGSVAGNLGAIGFTSPSAMNLKLNSTSPYASGMQVARDGTDMGANMNTLLTAQGAVGQPTVPVIGTTTATISWWAFDGSLACAVDYAKAPNDPSTQIGGGRLTAAIGNSQSVSLTGLTAITNYNYRVLCPVNQPTGSFPTK